MEVPAERRGNVGGRGTEKPRSSRGCNKPRAIVGERPVVDPLGWGPLSLWNAFLLIGTIIR